MTVRILIGDVRDRLRELGADSIDCVITSPPYWGLRDYGVAGQLGMEPTLGEHIETLVDVFRELRRVVKPKAPVWLNYGDCYATSPNGRSAADTKAAGNDDRTFRDKPSSTIGPVFDPNHSGRRGQDGRGKAEYQYGNVPGRIVAGGYLTGPGAHGSFHRNGREKGASPDKQRGHSRRHVGFNDRWDAMTKAEQQENGRFLRTYEPNVWHIATAAFKESHFATFPPALVERCLMASMQAGGVVLDPFGGAGTVGMVADGMGHDAVLIELSEEYAEIARARIADVFRPVWVEQAKQPTQQRLFDDVAD